MNKVINGHKVCPKCKVSFPLNIEYYRPSNRYSYGFRPRCRKCLSLDTRLYRKRNPDKVKIWKSRERRKYKKKTVRHDERCEICGMNPKRINLAKDHCHKTGMYRGLLCLSCNTAIGLMKDSIEILSRAVDYLTKHRGA